MPIWIGTPPPWGHYGSCCCPVPCACVCVHAGSSVACIARLVPSQRTNGIRDTGRADRRTLKLTGVLPACFQVNQVKNEFSGVPQALYSTAYCICSYIGIWAPYSWIMVLFSYCQCARFIVFLFEIRGGSPESDGSDFVLNYMGMSSIARSMLAELTYIVLLVENWFLSWFTWKQAGITFHSRMLLACICCFLRLGFHLYPTVVSGTANIQRLICRACLYAMKSFNRISSHVMVRVVIWKMPALFTSNCRNLT